MITASEARKISENNCATKKLSEIVSQIKIASANGKFFICNAGYLQPEIRYRLEGLGYKIKIGNQYNESYYSVSW